MRKVAVYLGPSMGRREAENILEADYLPPIRRGDLALLPPHIEVVCIIDGEFYQNLAVSSKEIMALLKRGIRVYGASSMGALRAAETHSLGMVGVGEVFAMFRDGVLDGDDEVALVYDPRTYRNLSDSLVNLRAALKAAVAEQVINEAEMKRLVAQMKSCYFPYRSYKAIELLCPPLADFFQRTALPDLKANDARELLRAVKNMEQPAHDIDSNTGFAPQVGLS